MPAGKSNFYFVLYELLRKGILRFWILNLVNLILLLCYYQTKPLIHRLRRRKKIAKAIERQARKLKAKGIAVDLDALKSEYLAQHRGTHSESDIDEDDIQIDVVGGADSDTEPEDFSFKSNNPDAPGSSSRSPTSSFCKSEQGDDVDEMDRFSTEDRKDFLIKLEASNNNSSSNNNNSNSNVNNNISDGSTLSKQKSSFSIESLLYNHSTWIWIGISYGIVWKLISFQRMQLVIFLFVQLQ